MYFLNESLGSNSLTTLVCSAAIYFSRESLALLLHNRCTDQFITILHYIARLTNSRSFFLSRSEATDVSGAATLNKTLRLATISLRTEYQSPVPKPPREP